MTSELSCSIEAYKTVQGSSVSPVKGARPRLKAAAIASATQVFPDPGTPEIMAKVPDASLSCHSHSTGGAGGRRDRRCPRCFRWPLDQLVSAAGLEG